MENKDSISTHDVFKLVLQAYEESNKQNGISHSVTINQAKQIFASFADVLADLASKGESVTMRGFLKLGAKLRPKGTSTNPKNGETVQTEEKMIPQISYTKGFKEKVQELFKQAK